MNTTADEQLTPPNLGQVHTENTSTTTGSPTPPNINLGQAEAELWQQFQLFLQLRNVSAPAITTPLNWSNLRTLCPNKLDLDTATINSLKQWERGVKTFIQQYKVTAIDTFLTTIQSVTSEQSFSRIYADCPFEVIKSLVEGTQSVWLKRHNFYKLSQNADQSARNFYATVVEAAAECQLDKTYCDYCKRKAIDEQIIAKLTFGSKQRF